mgnify:CR=1 FL=1
MKTGTPALMTVTPQHADFMCRQSIKCAGPILYAKPGCAMKNNQQDDRAKLQLELGKKIVTWDCPDDDSLLKLVEAAEQKA